jgi:hypothetical protein
MYELAERLGQPLSTIMDMTVAEFDHWWTFLRMKQEKNNGSSSKSRHNNRNN